MVIHTCDRCGKNFPKLWKLRRHRERQFQCRQKIIPTANQPTPVPETVNPSVDIHDPEGGPGPSTQLT